MVQRHFVVVPVEGGGTLQRPLKEWLRSHPTEVPKGMNAVESTSHQLRAGLQRKGWVMRQTPTDVVMYYPGVSIGQQHQAELDEEVDEALSEAGVDPMPAFSLESQLRDFLASEMLNLQIVPGKRLRLYVDPTGRDGVEFPTGVGPIDILAIDEAGAFYVFELKRATSPDSAIGQLARYMGWIEQTIGKGKNVFGVIVAKQISRNLRYAVLCVPGVTLYEYEVSFRFNPAHDLI